LPFTHTRTGDAATSCWPRRKKTRPRRWRRKRPAKLRGRRYVARGTSHQDPAKRAAGETDGNQGENTGTGFGPRQRQRTRTRAAGSCQQHPRQRQLFRFSQRSNNGAASGTCNRPGIAQFHGTAYHKRDPAATLTSACARPLSAFCESQRLPTQVPHDSSSPNRVPGINVLIARAAG
jgi:hypothetical protein